MYEIKFSSQVTKFIRRLDRKIKERVKKKFVVLKEDPFRYLRYYEGDYYKFRIGDFRALISLDLERRIIFVDVFDKRGGFMISRVKVKVKKLKENAVLPRYVRDGDAAMDLCSTEDYLVKAGERMLISTGIAMELPEGYVSCIWGRSGLALKKGISVLGGLIEHTYRGEYGVILLNSGEEDFEIKVGDRIAQVMIQPVVSAEVEEVDSLSGSVRGDGAWGSSGR